MIEIKDLSLWFDGQSLYDRFCMQVKKGEKVTLAGESGTGKTTFLHLILGFIPIQEGTVKIMDQPLNADNIEYIRSNIAYVPQELHLPLGTAGEMFYMPFGFRQNRDKKPDRKKTHQTLEALGLPEHLLDKNLDEISGGQKQRLAIGSALLLGKSILILDEPTASLDGKSIQRVALMVFNRKDLTVLSTSHNKWWIEQSDKIFNLDHHGTNP